MKIYVMSEEDFNTEREIGKAMSTDHIYLIRDNDTQYAAYSPDGEGFYFYDTMKEALAEHE